MRVKAVRLYGKEDLRFEEFELGEIRDDEILAQVMTDSLCMSSYKAMLMGSDHRCIPEDIGENPVIMGHELCARILRTGGKVSKDYKPGGVFAVQAKMFFGDAIKSPGYCYPAYGGNATSVIVPAEVIGGGYILPFGGDAYFKASMAEPISCLVSALRSAFHLAPNNKDHIMGLKPGGSMAILAGCGPMGLGAAEVAMSMENRPARIVLTDIDEKRVARAKALLKSKNGVELEIVNTEGAADISAFLGNGRNRFDDILVMAPVPGVIGQADSLSGTDACINFFAGPTRKDFYAPVNFYDVHYNYKHIIGTSGGDVDDMREALRLIETGQIDVSVLISHIGGLNCAAEATKNLPRIPGAKKLIYCNADLPLTAIDEFAERGRTDPFFADLHDICAQNNMLWCREAEEYLLEHATPILED
ncbi:MDR/zinc-dependent alcohol dehydrogenase-like family protein [Christensenella intestinihominis]|uniref:zinc-binding dehydrogenase n=1 Tax=Christensenella intestinihominis TaxID=1851429 RepID=UPI00082F3F03|nr:zinc-binding dehydrogenase [Christensenella intestinihominis]